jgi:hypothetical protein
LFQLYFGDRVLKIICPGWSQALILLISVSQVTRITSMNCWCLTVFSHFWINLCSLIFPLLVLGFDLSTSGIRQPFYFLFFFFSFCAFLLTCFK